MEMNHLSTAEDERLLCFIDEHWHGRTMVVHGECIDMSTLQAVCILEQESVTALLTYRFKDTSCEIMSLNSTQPSRGHARALLDELRRNLPQTCRRIEVVTTNDNLRAIGFYQRYGFDLTAVRLNELERSRTLKPSIPLQGENGIALLHELVFTLNR